MAQTENIQSGIGNVSRSYQGPNDAFGVYLESRVVLNSTPQSALFSKE